MRVFLYGTLQHEGLLEIVLGHVPKERLSVARLDGYAVSKAAGHDFPLIEKEPGGVAQGLLLDGVSTSERERLDHYELGFGYRLAQVEIAGQAALVYLPEAGLWKKDGPWSLAEWSETAWPHVQYSAREIMSYLGHAQAADLAWRFAMIGARAQARVFAERLPAPTDLRRHTRAKAVEVLDRSISHFGFFRTDTYRLRHPRFDGTLSAEMEREVFVAADAALVLPYDPRRGRVLLIEQFRMGPFARGDGTPWVLEPIAGRIDAGETPQTAARRECAEEAGLELDDLIFTGRNYPSPGEATTYFHMFVGIADLPDDAAGLGGLDSEHEDIRSHVISLDAALAMIETGEINVGPLITLLYWLKLNASDLTS